MKNGNVINITGLEEDVAFAGFDFDKEQKAGTLVLGDLKKQKAFDDRISSAAAAKTQGKFNAAAKLVETEAGNTSEGAGAVGGAAGGAAAGLAFGPWGAVAGGVIGGVQGILQAKQNRKINDANATIQKEGLVTDARNRASEKRSQIINNLSNSLTDTLLR